MSWKDIDPERRAQLIDMLSTDARLLLASAQDARVPSGRDYFERMGQAYSAAAEALKLLAEAEKG